MPFAQRVHWPVGINNGSGREHLSAIETKQCAPTQWLHHIAGTWAHVMRRFVLGQDASQIQRQQSLNRHNEDLPVESVSYKISCPDYLER